jgi:hypothetical protein
MEVKYAAMFASVQAGKGSVTELCAGWALAGRDITSTWRVSVVRGWRGCSLARGGRCGARYDATGDGGVDH